MDAKQLREAIAKGEAVDVAKLVDALGRFEKRLEHANKKIAELSKSNRVEALFLPAHEKRMEELKEKTRHRSPLRISKRLPSRRMDSYQTIGMWFARIAS